MLEITSMNNNVQFLLYRVTDTRRSYELWGLPNSEEVIDSLKIGIPLIVVGLLVFYFSTINSGKNKNKDSSSNTGCIGMIIIGIGAIALFPLLTWIEYMAVSGMSIFFGIIILLILISVIYNFIKKT